MVKKPIFLDDPFGSPLPSPTPLLSTGSLKKVPGSALAERILNDPKVWKLLDGGSITDLRLPLDSSGIEEEMTWLESEVKAFNLLSPSSMFGESLTSQISDATHSFDANSLKFASNHFETAAAPNTKSMPQRRVSSKPQPIDLSYPYIYNPPGSLDEPKQSNEEPQSEADFHVRLYHRLGRTDETRPLMGTVSVTEPVHDLSPPSSESSSNSSLSSGFHPSDDRTTPSRARPVCFALGPPSPNSGSTSLVSPLMAHSASTTLSFLEWYGIGIDSKVAHTVEYQSLARATAVQQSEADPSQPQQVLPGAKCDDDAAPRLSGAEAIIPYEIGGQAGQVPGTRTTAETDSWIPSKDEEQKDRTDFKSKILAIHARDSTKPTPTLDLPTVLNVTPPTIPPKDRAPYTYAKTDISREMTSSSSVRRLPVVPTQSATLTFESGRASLLVDGPLPIPPHTSVHTLRRSNTNTLGTGAPQTPYRSVTQTPSGFGITPTTTSNPSTRSPPCPVGPRNRHRRNNTTPIKSAWQGKNNTSITVSRSVSASRVSPLHGLK